MGAFIPQDARWYLAEIVEEIRVENEANNIVHVNLVLVRADSPEEAYIEAIKLGGESNQVYHNTDNQVVRIHFRGLRDLNVIHEELEHGSEIAYEEKEGISEPEILQLVRTKNDLGVFRAIHPSSSTNYMPKEIQDQLDQFLKSKQSPNEDN